MKNNYFVLFSGGTGGHVIPAVNLGNYLIDQGCNCALFIDKRGLQYTSKFKGTLIKIRSAHFSGNILYKFKSIFFFIVWIIAIIFLSFKNQALLLYWIWKLCVFYAFNSGFNFTNTKTNRNIFTRTKFSHR